MSQSASEDLAPSTAPQPQLDSNKPNPSQQVRMAESLELAKAAVRVIAENRGQSILLLDLSEQTSLFDYFVIASGTSRKQIVAMATEVDRAMKSQFHEQKLSMSGAEDSRWVVLDYGSIVVHMFDEETRRFYDLESLWGDARQVDINDLVSAASAQMARIRESGSF